MGIRKKKNGIGFMEKYSSSHPDQKLWKSAIEFVSDMNWFPKSHCVISEFEK